MASPKKSTDIVSNVPSAVNTVASMREVAALTIEYRQPSMTVMCIDSLLEEGVAHVLVVDNSDDGGASASILRGRFEGESRIEVVESGRNLGFAAGVNVGLACLRAAGWNGPSLLINNDAVLAAGALRTMVEVLDGVPTASVIYPTVLHAGQALGVTYYHRATGLLTQNPLRGSFPFVSGCCVLIAPSLTQTNLFDETFFMYGEDVELSWRLARQQFMMIPAPTATVRHVGSAASGLGSEFYETHMVAGHFILARRLARDDLTWISFIGCRVITLSLRALIRCVRYRSWIPLRALGRGMSVAIRALKSRRTSIS